MSRHQPLVVFVPAQTALTYDGRAWRLVQAPPQWWLDEREEQLLRDEQRSGVLRLMSGRTTPCRPGHGPCRRRHEHASPRRDERALQAS